MGRKTSEDANPHHHTGNGSLLGFDHGSKSQRMLLFARTKDVPTSTQVPFLGVPMSVWHTFRIDGYGDTASRKLNPVQAIRQQCRECYGFCENVAQEIKDCPSEMCPLYPFRFGKDPGVRRTEKQRESGRRVGLSRRGGVQDSGNTATSPVGECTGKGSPANA
jgi:hypothetical protein